MLTLAHISDIHLPLQNIPNYRTLLNKRITGYLNWKFNRKTKLGSDYLDNLVTHLLVQEPDHIVVTGDLVNLSLDQEFEAGKEFLEKLGDPNSVSAICGNHDAYVPGALSKAEKIWSPWMSADGDALFKTGTFPYLRVRDNVALIGCNSAEATLPFMATGYFRRDQDERLRALLDETQHLLRVVMIHHPPVKGATPYQKRLIGIDRFQSAIADCGADLILHGHTHLETCNWISGKNGKVPVICVPAAGNSVGGHRPAGQYNFFTLEGQAGVPSIHWQAYGCNEEHGEIALLKEKRLI